MTQNTLCYAAFIATVTYALGEHNLRSALDFGERQATCGGLIVIAIIVSVAQCSQLVKRGKV